MLTDEAKRQTLSAAITVWIIEDHESYRETVVGILDAEEDITCTGEFGDVESMLNAIPNAPPPDVVLMDIGLPGKNGIKGVLDLKKRLPSVPAVMLTVFGDNDSIYDAICAGAKGYLLKTAPTQSILNAIREAKEGGSIISPKIARKTLDMFAKRNQAQNESYNLTPRETEVLNLCKKGKTKKEIAALLCRSVSTIDTHVRNIYEKLEVNSRTALIKKLYGLHD